VQVAKITNSTTIVRVNNTHGPDHIEVYRNEWNVELSIRHGIAANTTNSTTSSINTSIPILEATVKNTGTEPIFLYAFRIFGQTPSGYQALSAEVLDSDYSKDLWGSAGLPIPMVTERIRLNPGESLSALFKGNWKVEPLTKQLTTLT
jgi:hypothetical protein